MEEIAMFQFTLAQEFHLQQLYLGLKPDCELIRYTYKEARQACINTQNRLIELTKDFDYEELKGLWFTFSYLDGSHEHLCLLQVLKTLESVLDDRHSVTVTFLAASHQGLRVAYLLENGVLSMEQPP